MDKRHAIHLARPALDQPIDQFNQSLNMHEKQISSTVMKKFDNGSYAVYGMIKESVMSVSLNSERRDASFWKG